MAMLLEPGMQNLRLGKAGPRELGGSLSPSLPIVCVTSRAPPQSPSHGEPPALLLHGGNQNHLH